MLGIFLVVASVILAAYLVIKRYYAPWALLMVGLLLLICVSIISGTPLVTGKKATHSAVFDIVQVFTNLLQSRTAGIGMNIICVGGFAYYMDKIGATKALVNICIKPLSYIHAPYVLLGVAYLVGQLLNVFIPSAVCRRPRHAPHGDDLSASRCGGRVAPFGRCRCCYGKLPRPRPRLGEFAPCGGNLESPRDGILY